MDLFEVNDIVAAISDGIEEACRTCLVDQSGIVLSAVTEQLLCGLDGEGNYLTPTYDDDPFFNEQGPWYHRSYAYKAWKKEITPPQSSRQMGGLLTLPARPDSVPNLKIDGTFHSEINATPDSEGLMLDPGNGNGPAIVAKYGDQILKLGSTAVDYFNEKFMEPAIERFIKGCGYV